VEKQPSEFDVGSLYEGPVSGVGDRAGGVDADLREKLRQAYLWIVNYAIISPVYDIEYNDGTPQVLTFGDSKSRVTLPSGHSFSSFVLLPLLTLALRRKCLLVGGPGRGKTASAVLMGLVAGYTMKDIQRAIQHGQPQMTVADLLGNPLPSSLVNAKSADDIQISWRRWLGMRVKIIDEYNRIPTRTQSALLTVMSDNYAELFDQVFECPDSAWYLTANDEAGGGTYQVIEALRDRIDVVVKALHFNTRFLGELLTRIEAGARPEDFVPEDIVFTEEELSRVHKEILKVKLPVPLRRRIEFFAAQFEFLETAADQIEYKTKDTVKLSGVDLALVMGAETGKDRSKDLGTQTRNGLSVRALMTVLAYVKGMAYFRGEREVSFEDVRQLLPFVLHDKLVIESEAAFFEAAGNSVYRADKIGWIRKLFDLSCAEYGRLGLDAEDPVRDLSDEFARGLEGLSAREVSNRLAKIEAVLKEWSKGRKVYGHLFDDILTLKYLHQRYTNFAAWLKTRG
ncbi:MAG: AAA family ATPase, partial [Acidobacteria bacterium]|nr:AAA family ATPase [Acidobacteriota bacterium]